MNPDEINPMEMRLDLPAVHMSVRIGRRVVQTFARTADIADAEIDCLMLVVSELLANAVDHGGGGGAMQVTDLAKDVRMGLEIKWDGKTWTISVEDEGVGDLEKAQECLARGPESVLDALEQERGRGLFLVSDAADGLVIKRGARGLVFVATKTL